MFSLSLSLSLLSSENERFQAEELKVEADSWKSRYEETQRELGKLRTEYRKQKEECAEVSSRLCFGLTNQTVT